MKMLEYNKFKDIPTYNNWNYIKQISQGFSNDLNTTLEMKKVKSFS